MTDIWQCKKITVTLASDLHCGDLPLGFVSRTLPYVPQHIPLYALVPVAVEALGLPDRTESYETVEKFFKNSLRFLPLFICLGDNFLAPWNDEERQSIESCYLGSRYGVALAYQERAAIKNRLFETEVIFSRSREDARQTTLSGFLFYKPDKTTYNSVELCLDGKGFNSIPFTQLLRCCQLGGERNKGFGALADATVAETSEVYGSTPMLADLEMPKLLWPAEKPAPFYLRYSEEQEKELQGRLRPLSGRRFKAGSGPGLRAEHSGIVWDMGWQATTDVTVGLDYNMARLLNNY